MQNYQEFLESKINFDHYGFRLGEDGKTLVKHEEERQALSLIHQYHGQGLSLRGISARLAEQGILARQGRPFAPSTLKTLIAQATS